MKIYEIPNLKEKNVDLMIYKYGPDQGPRTYLSTYVTTHPVFTRWVEVG